MNKDKIQEWIQIIESRKYNWCYFLTYDPKTNSHCPIGMAAKEWGFTWPRTEHNDPYILVSKQTGLSLSAIDTLWTINDGSSSKEIALRDVIEYLKSLLEE